MGRESQFFSRWPDKTALLASYLQPVVMENRDGEKWILIGRGIADVGVQVVYGGAISVSGKIFPQPTIGNAVQVPIPNLILFDDVIDVIMAVNGDNKISVCLGFAAEELMKEMVIADGV